jgi:formate hydrogenlyase subunit 3/multisubunit Na+/H+ antiporter MnhD subunit
VTSMFSTLLGPILTLWTGALVFYLIDRFLEPQDKGVAEAVALVLGMGFLLGSRPQVNHPIQLAEFPTDAGWTGMWPFAVAGEASWLLALILLGSALVASLATLGRPTHGRAGRLATLGAALLFLFAGDWATLALAWALVDVCLLYTLGQDREQVESLGWTGVLSLGGAVILGVASLLWQQAGGGVWVDKSGAVPAGALAATSVAATDVARASLSPWVTALLMLACTLRLMPFPLPMWEALFVRTRSQEEGPRDTRPAMQVVVYAVPTLLGAYLWTRLAQWGVTAQGGKWLSVLSLWAGCGLLAGAVKAWGARDPDALISCASIYGGASVLLGAGLELPAGWQLVVGVNVVLSVSVLFVSWVQCQYLDILNPRSYWRAVPTGLVLLSLAGFPLTVGFPARIAVYQTMFTAEKWLLLLLSMAAEALIFGALLRIVFDVETVRSEERPDDVERVRAEVLVSRPLAVASEALTPSQRMQKMLSVVRSLTRFVRDVPLRQLDWRREIGYGAGVALACGVVTLGIAPQLLRVDGSLSGLGRWFGVPTLPVWAAWLLSVVGAIVLYRHQDVVLALAEEWWPLVRHAFHFDWVYRAIGNGLHQVRALIWGASRVVEGAGYMAWVVLVCLVVLLFVVAR